MCENLHHFSYFLCTSNSCFSLCFICASFRLSLIPRWSGKCGRPVRVPLRPAWQTMPRTFSGQDHSLLVSSSNANTMNMHDKDNALYITRYRRHAGHTTMQMHTITHRTHQGCTLHPIVFSWEATCSPNIGGRHSSGTVNRCLGDIGDDHPAKKGNHRPPYFQTILLAISR